MQNLRTNDDHSDAQKTGNLDRQVVASRPTAEVGARLALHTVQAGDAEPQRLAERRQDQRRSGRVKTDTKMFLVAFEFENITVWRINDDDLLDLVKHVFRTIGAGHTEGPIPKVTVKRVTDGETNA